MASMPSNWIARLACLGPIGHLPKAPGTWGTLVALPAAAILIYLLPLGTLVFVCILMILGAVWCCSQAEQILGLRDPGCVVLDEWIAVPCCYIGPLLLIPEYTVILQSTASFVSLKGLSFHAAVFVLFRLFDIFKPWPVGPSQKWPRGWGVVMDDVLAAGYVNMVLLAGLALF